MTTTIPTYDLTWVPLDQVTPDPTNPRRISDAELDALTRSVQEFGLVQPLIVNTRTGKIVGGHQRLLAARRLGHATVPVIFLDLTADQAQLLNLGLNRIGGEWDEALLARLLADLQAIPNVDLTVAGFGEDELRNLLRSLDRQSKRDQAETFDLATALAEPTRALRTQPGDVWVLGEHRVGCGDSTQPDQVARLLGTVHPHMAFTDPPYNVAYGDHGGHSPGTRRRRLANDDLSAEAWEAFGRGWIPTLVEVVDGALYICMSSKEWPVVARLLAEAGAHWSDTIIWSKNAFTLGRADYQRQYEPIWYGWREGAAHFWAGRWDLGDVWQLPRAPVAELHPTLKPLPLIEQALEQSSQPGDVVLDLFLGAGSTLLAAERTGRICCGMELEPWYVDITLARWERFTGQVAQRIEDRDVVSGEADHVAV